MSKPKFQITRGTMIVLITLAVIVTLRVIPFFWSLRPQRVEPQIELNDDATGSGHSSGESSRGLRRPPPELDGEVARTAERMLEAEALALVSSLYVVGEAFNNRRVTSAGELVKGLTGSGMLPPGVVTSGPNNSLTSERSDILIRFRPAPIGVEIVSFGRERKDGPALIVRVPDDSQEDGAGAQAFVARSLEQVNVPPAFIDTAQVIVYGWDPEPLRLANASVNLP